MPQNKRKIETDADFYPHFKLTGGDFPRLLVTRRILDKKSDYFGAFLPATAVRIRLSHLIKIFRLRGCQFEIDGNFELPCYMYFSKKCRAPCVENLCSRSEYKEFVDAARYFIGGHFAEFEKLVNEKIEKYAGLLEFEKAARWRDIWRDSFDLRKDKKFELGILDAVDTYTFKETAARITIYLITTRGRKFLGDKEFVFSKRETPDAAKALEIVLQNFYQFSVPREIRLPLDFPAKKQIEKELCEKFNPNLKITVSKQELNKTAEFRFKRTALNSDLSFLSQTDAAKSAEEIKRIFKLRKKPRLIEAFDVAHIGNSDFVTASSVWEKGNFLPQRAQFWLPEKIYGEPQAMAAGIRLRLMQKPLPDLILIDGSFGQLNAVREVLREANIENTDVISIVKPPGKHNSASHFLAENNQKIKFLEGEKAYELLRRLRDEAHQTANDILRQYRDNKYIFGAANSQSADAEKIPLVVVRYDEISGNAEDLQPIATPLKKFIA